VAWDKCRLGAIATPTLTLNGADTCCQSVARLIVAMLDLNRYKELGQIKYTHDKKIRERDKIATAYGKLVGEEF
jgi:hypothetical protein